jgi:cyclophilin family peptidyl-prolyl cis-trans isomerase
MRFSRSSLIVAAAGLALGLAACATIPPSAEERAQEAERIMGLARQPARSPSAAGSAALAIQLAVTDPKTENIPALRPGARVTFGQQLAVFDLALSEGADAPEQIDRMLPDDAPADLIAAAAMGLITSKAAAAERVLIALALRPAQECSAVEALFAYYRQPGAKPAPAILPSPDFLAYAKHRVPRARAALGHLARAIKDPALIEPLVKLTRDDFFEVRRAAVLGLAEISATSERPAAQRATCLKAILPRLDDRDPHVVIAACRAASSYNDPSVAPALLRSLEHRDFNVRVAALEGLGRRKATSAVAALTKLARTDRSVSVRATAASQLAVIDSAAAQTLVDGLLADASPYVRSAAAAVLGKSPDPAAHARLAQLAKSDPHVRVRESALTAFEGHTDSPAVREALRSALNDADPVVVATACGVIAKAKLADFAAAIAAIPVRFRNSEGADAREGAIDALAALGGTAHRALFESLRTDSHPAVRDAAGKALALLAQQPPPPPSRGADLSGELLPGGAPLFEREVFLVLETARGTMRIALYHELAPVHCAHVAALARAGRYNGLTWHRVVPDFVVQGGCPRGDGSGSAGVSLPLEPSFLPFERGTLGMPRSANPDSGGCQLFISTSRAPHLDTAYTVFGRVVEGLEVLDRIDVDTKIERAWIVGAH